MKAIPFLEAIAGYVRNSPSSGSSSADRPIRLATIDPAYGSFSGLYPNGGINPAKVTFDGESTVSGKAYPVANGFIPAPNQRVWMVPVGTTYLIVGGASPNTSQGFYSKPDDTIHGLEFGNGNYFDTLEGLHLDTDAHVGGALDVSGALEVGGRVQVSNEKVNSGLLSVSSNATTSFANTAGSPGTMTFTKLHSGTATKLIIYLKLSLRVSAGTVPTVAKIAVNISGGSGDHEVDHEVLQVSGVHYPMVGLRELTGFAAGTYTIQARYRPVSAGVTLSIDANDYLSMHVREVAA